MANAHLATYLNDHLSGATSALAMLDHLASAYAGSEIARFASELRADVLADRAELERIMATVNVGHSPVRKAAAWAAEKLVELKVRVDDPAKCGLHLLELLESLSLGIEGKRSLWRSLATIAALEPAVDVADYDALIQRAEAQRASVEERRLAAARIALLG